MASRTRADVPVMERGLPANPDVERLVLGAVLLDANQFKVVTKTLAASDFSLSKHRLIYSAMAGLHDTRQPIDRVTLAEELMKRGQLEAVDGLGYLVSLDDGLPQIYNVESYCGIIKDKSLLRQIIFNSQKVIERAMIGEDSPATLLADAEKNLGTLAKEAGDETGVSLAQYIDSYEGGIEGLLDFSKRTKGIPTGFPKFDLCSGYGLHPGEYFVIGARPGVGKTALASGLARNVARYTNQRVLYFTPEITKGLLVDRLIFSESQVPAGVAIKKSEMQPHERSRLQGAVTSLYDTDLVIDDTVGIDPTYIMRSIVGHSRNHKIAAVFVDYIQLLSGGKGMRFRDANERLTHISAALRDMAKSLMIPFVVLSQLRRTSDKGKQRKPTIEDLRESGSIEQDAWVICLLHREEKDGRQDISGKLEAIIDKNRIGPRGSAFFRFDGATSTFYEEEGDGDSD